MLTLTHYVWYWDHPFLLFMGSVCQWLKVVLEHCVPYLGPGHTLALLWKREAGILTMFHEAGILTMFLLNK